jgi:hypothetical protein
MLEKHLLADILLLCFIVMVCGIEDIENIAFFDMTHIQWLKKYLKLPHGIPSADTILRVLSRIDSKQFEALSHGIDEGLFQGTGSVITMTGRRYGEAPIGAVKPSIW